MHRTTLTIIICCIVIPVWLYIGYTMIVHYVKLIRETKINPFNLFEPFYRYYIKRDLLFRQYVDEWKKTSFRLFVYWIIACFSAMAIALIIRATIGVYE